MSEKRTTARAFHDAIGVEDWRVLFSGAHAYFRVGSFGEAARFVAAIAEVAEVVGHFPDVDVRPEGVTVRTASGEYGALSHRDVELARQISALASAGLKRINVSIDSLDPDRYHRITKRDALSSVLEFAQAGITLMDSGNLYTVENEVFAGRVDHEAFVRELRPRAARRERRRAASRGRSDRGEPACDGRGRISRA